MRSPRRSGAPWGPESTPWWSLRPPLHKKGPSAHLEHLLHGPLPQYLLLCPLPLHLCRMHVAKLLQGFLVLLLQAQDLSTHLVQGHGLLLLQQAPLIKQSCSQLLLPRKSSVHCTPNAPFQHPHSLGPKAHVPPCTGQHLTVCPWGPEMPIWPTNWA